MLRGFHKLSLAFGTSALLGCSSTDVPPPAGSSGSGGNTAGSGGGNTAGSGGGKSGAGGTGGMMAADGGTGTITDRYGRRGVVKDNRRYVIQNNVWGNESAQQTLTFNSTAFTVTQQTGSNAGQAAPVSFPSTWIGSNGNNSTSGSNLPIAISAITSIPTTWTINAAVEGSFNAAYDLWFSTSPSGDPESTVDPTGGFVMVWFHDPAGAQPAGSQTGTATIAGQTWNVWARTSGKPYIAYVAPSTITSLTFDLKPFITDAVTRGVIPGGWTLTNVFAGFEIWSGGVGLATTDFSVVVN